DFKGRIPIRSQLDSTRDFAPFANKIPAISRGFEEAVQSCHGSPPNMQKSSANILLTREDSVAVITLNRPERRNALSLALMRELIEAFDSIGRGRETRAVILAAAGKVFCAGHDLSEMGGRDINGYRETFDVCSQLMLKI